ncbi:MAG: hypothetical protein JWN34_4144 [Bryobacterales bacterium]|nr:hypothetical protein [Bryobacterales bacterium]
MLMQRGKIRAEGEDYVHFVSRGFEITPKNARALLRLLQDGNPIEDAMLIIGIESKVQELTRLTRIARAIGAAFGTFVARIRSLSPTGRARAQR